MTVMTTTTERTLRGAFIDEPLRLAKTQPHQVLISTLSVSLTAEFFADGDVVSRFVAYVAAIGVEYAFLKGLADSSFAASQRDDDAPPGLTWGSSLVWSAFALLVIAGTYVLMTRTFGVTELKAPPAWGAVVLSLAHILPLALIGLCSAQLHAEAERLQLAMQRKADAELAQKRRDEEARVEARRAEDEARERRKAEALERIELDKAARLAEIESTKLAKFADVDAMEAATMARQRLKATSRDASQIASQSTDTDTSQPRHKASGSPKTVDRHSIFPTLRDAVTADPKFNRQAFADAHGISRPMVNKLLGELEELDGVKYL